MYTVLLVYGTLGGVIYPVLLVYGTLGGCDIPRPTGIRYPRGV